MIRVRQIDIKIEEDSIDLLKPEKSNVVCFMGCADNSKLISGFTDLLK